MNDRAFVDTNVLVYCFDSGESAKRTRALELLEGGEDELVISTQVLQEFYVTVVRKLARPLSEADAEKALHELSALPTVTVDTALVLSAVALARSQKLSLWDALIVEAARAAGCVRLLTEDLQHGLQVGDLVVVNPFLGSRKNR
jgi:predicted nucleic acid-binding protein